MSKRAVVTGGGGFIGHHLTKRLLNDGWFVTVLDDFSTGDMDNLEPDPKLKIEVLDISCDPLPTIEFDALFHLAAPVSVAESLEDPMKYWRGISVASRRVIEWSKLMGATSVVAASTAATYGDSTNMPLKESHTPEPISPYADFKLEMEWMMKNYNTPEFKCGALRFFNVFGEGQRATGGYRSVVPIFLELRKLNKPVTITGDGTQTRDWIYVGDIVNAIIKMHESDWKEEMPIYNAGSGIETQVIQVADAFGGDKVHIEKRKEPARSVADITLITSQLDWKPETDLIEWIKSTQS